MDERKLIKEQSVTHFVDVNATPELVFDIFLNNPQKWWPTGHSLFGKERPNIYFEPFEGGKWFETDDADNKKYWGKVTFLIPNVAFGMTWQIDKRWQPVDDIAISSRIGVFLEKLTESTTRVHLSHYELGNHGNDAEPIILAITGPNPGATLESLGRYIEQIQGSDYDNN